MTTKALIRLFFLILLLLPSCTGNSVPPYEEDLRELDRILDSADEYVQVKELRINTIENMLSSRGTTRLQQYNIYGELFTEYYPYQFNKAIDALSHQEELAGQLRSEKLLNDARLERAMLYILSGLHLEADKLMREIDTTALEPLQKLKWYDVRQKFITEYAEYLQTCNIDVEDICKVPWYQEQILRSLPESSTYYRQLHVTWLIRENRLEEALVQNAGLIGSLDEGTHDYAIATYWHGVIYDRMNKVSDAISWWARSAVCDVRQATKDNASLYSIANKLYGLGDTERAFRYMQVSLDDAVFYNSMLRRVQIASTLPLIERAYSATLSRQQERMQTVLILLICSTCILAIAMGVVIWLTVKMRRKSQEVNSTNRRLESYSHDLEKIENSLMESNTKLREANQAKEEYLGLFLSQSSGYLDKLRKMLPRDQYEDELKSFYKTFDTSFLELYPTFVEEFNSLLKPEGRIELKEDARLTIELRIFALIKLGITQSSHIASLLRYSVNTIYNYRAQVKNSAMNNRENFEDMVRKIGSKS